MAKKKSFIILKQGCQGHSRKVRDGGSSSKTRNGISLFFSPLRPTVFLDLHLIWNKTGQTSLLLLEEATKSSVQYTIMILGLSIDIRLTFFNPFLN